MFRSMLITLAIGIAVKVGDPRYLAYELDIIRRVIEGVESVLKMPRQTGKTWVAAVVAVAYLMRGKDVLVAYPTLIQGHKLLLSSIAWILRRLGIGLVKFNSLGIELSSGPRVHVVTTHESAVSVEGYTVGLLIVDESHRAQPGKLGEMAPALKVAYETGEATVLLLGVKGIRQSLIEVAWRERAFNLIHIKPDEILSVFPGYQVALDAFHKILSDEEYAAQILCEGEVSNRSIFHNITEPLPEFMVGKPYTRGLGYDIGQIQDATIGSLLRIYPSNETPHVVIFETQRYKGKYTQQGEDIKDYIHQNGLRQSPVCFETNGIGRGLYDIVSHVAKDEEYPIESVTGFTCTARSKVNVVKWLQWLDRDHCLHCVDEPMLNALDGLEEHRTDEGKMKYDHSDYLSSLIVAGSMIGYG